MHYVTFGGVTVGICILLHHLITWWPGRKALMKDPARQAGELAPFLIAWAYGALTVLGVGGLIGWLARAARWISNWLGDVALVWGVGVTTGTRGAAPTYIPLTQAGGAIVLILTVALVAAVKKSKWGSAIKRGAWCGVCLGTSAGVAGFAAAPLAIATNWLGNALFGAM
ncbi:hypothetical protein ACN2WE_21400 [Streptomyces sp. cg28]|uniref:hypothetical protein n=1 Tax=Streptomyces sp. cg28 TaxID=3403457 RepID=UPI003B22779E